MQQYSQLSCLLSELFFAVAQSLLPKLLVCVRPILLDILTTLATFSTQGSRASKSADHLPIGLLKAVKAFPEHVFPTLPPSKAVVHISDF